MVDRRAVTTPPGSLHVRNPEELLDELAAARAALRSIAFKANELAQDGLMAKGTGCQIRDKALRALGAEGDEAIQIIRGDYE